MPSSPINISKIWRVVRTKWLLELHQTLFPPPQRKTEKAVWLCETVALVGLTAGWQADEITLDFVIIKILHRLNYLDFYFVDTIAKLLIVLEVHSACSSQTKHILGCILSCIKLVVIFSCQSLLLGTSISIDARRFEFCGLTHSHKDASFNTHSVLFGVLPIYTRRF